jgi:hypothetical protein
MFHATCYMLYVMYHSVNEPIDVIVAFKAGKAEPAVFKWNGKHYRIRKINLVHTERKGRDKQYIFSVSDGANAFRLRFHTETLKWELEEMAIL